MERVGEANEAEWMGRAVVGLRGLQYLEDVHIK